MRRRYLGVLGLLAVLLSMLTLSTIALAQNNVRIQDDANVLSAQDRTNITNAARRAPFPVTVWTTTRFTAKNDFYSAVDNQLGSNGVVLGVDPTHRWSHIGARQGTGLSSAQLTQAQSAGNSHFGTGDWGGGFTAAINQLVGVAPASGSGGSSQPAPVPAPSSGPGFLGFGLGGCLLLAAIVGILGFLLLRRRPAAPGVGPMMGPGVQPPYPPQGPVYPQQGGYPGYPVQGGYGGYPQQGGSNLGSTLGAGAIGAAAGGLIGYELGRNQNDQQANNPGYDPSNQGYGGSDFGGGGGIIDSDPGSAGNAPDFGGSDFGGGGSDFGGSSDFGGGSDSSSGGSDF